MSFWFAVTVLVVLVALVAGAVGVLALLWRLDLTREQRSVRTTTSPAKRTEALRRIRRREDVTPRQTASTRAVATALASHGGPALTYTGFAVVQVTVVLGSFPAWLVALAGVAAVVDLVVAAALAVNRFDGRRFLAAHPGTGQRSR